MEFIAKKLRFAGLASIGAVLLSALGTGSASAAVESETAYILNTFSFLVHGFLVMFMAAGFAMLESGLVRAKNTATICLKNIALYSVAGLMFYLVGYNLMYAGVDGGFMGTFALWSGDNADALAGKFDAGDAADLAATTSRHLLD